MSRARFFLDAEMPSGVPASLPLAPADLHHAIRVLRVSVGEELDVVTPAGAVWRVLVAGVAADEVSISSASRLPDASAMRIALFQGVAKGDKMDTIVRQAVEVGASLVVPVVTSRTVVRLTSDKALAKGERWRRVARSAAEQARREQVPLVADPITFAEALPRLREWEHAIVLWEEGRGRPLSAVLRGLVARPTTGIALFVGPEGGLSAEEVSALEAHGAHVASLGPSVLRTETAAVVALGVAVGVLQEAGEPRDS